MKCREKYHVSKVLIDEFDEVSGRLGWVPVITLAGVTNLGDRF